MRGWKSLLEHGLLACLALLFAHDAQAQGIFIRHAETYLDGDVLRLDADIDYRLPDDVREGLENGLAVILALEIHILRHRDWLWNETVAQLTQRYRLRYLPLSQQYEVINLNSGARYAYPSLTLALKHMDHPRALPLVDRRLLQADAQYLGALRAYIDADELPVTLRLLSHFTSGWRAGSDWYRWPIELP